MVLAWHLLAVNIPCINLQVTLGALAVAQNQTQPPHLRPGMSVLGHEDGSTLSLTVARVHIHVTTTSHVAGMASTGQQHTQLLLPSNTWRPGCGSESDPAASLAPRYECAGP